MIKFPKISMYNNFKNLENFGSCWYLINEIFELKKIVILIFETRDICEIFEKLSLSKFQTFLTKFWTLPDQTFNFLKFLILHEKMKIFVTKLFRFLLKLKLGLKSVFNTKSDFLMKF